MLRIYILCYGQHTVGHHPGKGEWKTEPAFISLSKFLTFPKNITEADPRNTHLNFSSEFWIFADKWLKLG